MKLKPYLSNKIWGWEKWNLSCHPDGKSTIENGPYKGMYFADVIKDPESFPILIKIIYAKSRLSIQVHPDDDYARLFEKDNGKSECWYILDAGENGTLVVGLKKKFTRQEIQAMIDAGALEYYLNTIDIASGDFIYIPTGTIHTINSGIRLIEVQQSSNVTYRLYDWGRPRELHIEKSLDVIDYETSAVCGKVDGFQRLKTPHFTVEKLRIKNSYEGHTEDRFHSYTVADGSGHLIDEYGNVLVLSCEDTIFIPEYMSYTIFGNMTLIKAYGY